MLQSWLDKRYQLLYDKFSTESFRLADAEKILKERFNDSKQNTNAIISELRKKKLLTTEIDPDDARKKIYKFIEQEKIISEKLAVGEVELSRNGLHTILKKAADLIRTRVDYTFILIMLFFKRINDKWEREFEEAYNEALETGLSEEEARTEAKNAIYHDFDIPEGYTWEDLRKDTSRLPENFSRALKLLAERNPELRDVFEYVEFTQFTSSRENAEILRQLVELFSARSLRHVSPDILGDAYEWILRYFAPSKAKEGEVYTAREVINLIVHMLDPEPGQSIYDPAPGSGGMLIMSYDYVKERYGKEEADKLFLYGQEANHKTLALAKMNAYIHDIRNANLAFGDTLLYPKFKEGDKLRTFDMVIANPPWNQDGYGEDELKGAEFRRERFRYGFTPKQSADWAWIQHMLASAKDENGKVGVVIDNGCLFRGGREKAVRAEILKDDLIESVILLPEKLFYNTGAPGAILILNKNKPKERRKKIFFINASKEFEKHPDVRKLNKLGEKNIENIAAAYREFKEETGFSRIVDLDAIIENDYNLNVTLYVFPEEEIEEIDIDKEWEELKAIDKEIAGVEKKLEGYLREIG